MDRFSKRNTNWRKDFNSYLKSDTFKNLFQEYKEQHEKHNAEKVAKWKTSPSPEVLILSGIPGSWRKEIAKTLVDDYSFIQMVSIEVMAFLEKKGPAAYPSAYVAYFYKEALMDYYLGLGCKVVSDHITREKETKEKHQALAKKHNATYRIISLQIKDARVALDRKLLPEIAMKKVTEIPYFEEYALTQPDSDEAAFAKFCPDWKNKTYGEFSEGRWEKMLSQAEDVKPSDASSVLYVNA